MRHLVALEDKGLEDAIDVLAQLGGHMDGRQVGLVHFVRDEFVRDASLIE